MCCRSESVSIADRLVGRATAPEPPYVHLLDTEEVLHRDQIYGSGPPDPNASSEILERAKRLPDPILDFGCGLGPLVRSLRREGRNAVGLELNREELTSAISHDVAEHIRFYDGSLPLPYKDGQFATVIATEVIEHIDNFRDVVSELSRIARRNLLVSVPDIASIPMCAPHGVVPWHLLEATHVNFFTNASLRKLLGTYFSDIDIWRIGNFAINGDIIPTSLLALCRR